MALLLLLLLPFVSSFPNGLRHFGETCTLCECFVEYTDRDVQLPYRPYAQAETPYEASEESCLATCIQDKICKAVVYGLVGGRNVFTCELYDTVQGTLGPITAAYTNIYIKRGKCDKIDKDLPSIPLMEADESSLKRRSRRLNLRPNPFTG